MSSCPSEEQLAAYAASACTPAAAAEIQEHLAGCVGCQSWLNTNLRAEHWFRGIRSTVGESALEALQISVPAAGPEAAPAPEQGHSHTPAQPVIPGYEVIRELNHGGQGIVYEALQKKTKRRVAIKVLLEGVYASKTARARFMREVELVAQLRHPDIVAVFDSGVTADGRDYCVMDCIRGEPLTEYVRGHDLALPDVLRLFAAVCDAVQHAHQRGVIHRDLKPSNVIVDAEGRPKILDFGLAKQLSGPVDCVVTFSQEVIGTPAYMSPEQARGNPDAIDTRTDIYSLGVIFYEALTGRHPYPVEGPLADVLRHVVETPPTPLKDAWTGHIGGQRPGRLPSSRHMIDREVDTIVRKALAKERGRRYQSAGELAGDIRRYLADEPIEARRDSGWYVLRKTIKRYRAAVGVAVAFALVISAGLVTSLMLWRQARAETRRAEQLHHSYTEAVDLSRESWRVALQPAAQADWADLGRSISLIRQLAQSSSEHDLRELTNEPLRRTQGILSDKLTAALERNQLGPVARAFVAEPAFRETLRLLDESGYPGEPVARLCERLERWLQMPPPAGRLQEVDDCATLLSTLRPGNEPARAARTWLDQRWAALPIVCQDGFDAPELSSNWLAMHGSERPTVEGGRLRFGSTFATVGTMRMGLDAPGPTVVVELTLRFPVRPRLQRLRGTVSLYDMQSRTLADLDVVNNRLTCPQLPPKAPTGPAYGAIVETDTDYHIAIVVDVPRQRFDVIVNDQYVVEDVNYTEAGPIAWLCVGSGSETTVLVDNVVCRSGDACLKRDLGSLVPVVTVNDLPFLPTTHLPLSSQSVACADWNGDGQAELAAFDWRRRGELLFYKFRSSRLSAELVHTALVEPQACGAYALDNRHLGTIGNDVVSILEVGPDWLLTPCFRKDYRAWGNTGFGVTVLVPVDYTQQRHGFIVGCAYEGRGFEMFEADAAAPEGYRSLGFYRPYRPDEQLPVPSDIYSILPYDYDDDGGADLFIGWSFWHGYCPALVMLGADRPRDIRWPDNLNIKRQDFEPALPVPARPLTDAIGHTELALVTLGGQPHLVAASRRVAHPDGVTQGQGLRIWRIADLQAGRPEPRWFLPGQYISVAGGCLGDREVIAATYAGDDLEHERHELRLQIHALVRDELKVVWEAIFYDVPYLSAPQLFADLDGDQKQELIVNLLESGLLVFKAE